MHRNLISVIIPVYNVGKYLEECLNSVIQQTYKSFEIIVIDDGSTDGSLAILEAFALIHKNICIISQENSGQSVARNEGIKKATGKYIYFLDSDDYILPETFENLVKNMEEGNLDLIRFSAESFSDGVNIKMNQKKYDFNTFFDSNKVYKKEEFLKLNLITYSASPVLYFVKKEILTENNIFFRPGIIHEDDLFTVELFLNANSAMYNPNLFYKRRYRPNSTMTDTSLSGIKKSFDSRYIILNELSKMLYRYTEVNEVNLIKKRMRSITAMLIYNYEDLDKSYTRKKINSIRHIERISLPYYYYYLIRKKN